MLKATALTAQGNPLVLLGLSHENLDLLRDGKPISLRLGDMMGPAGLPAGHPLRGRAAGSVELVIYAGRDEESLAAELEGRGLAPHGATRAAQEALANRDTRVVE